jgi:hypothetical protein
LGDDQVHASREGLLDVLRVADHVAHHHATGVQLVHDPARGHADRAHKQRRLLINLPGPDTTAFGC